MRYLILVLISIVNPPNVIIIRLLKNPRPKEAVALIVIHVVQKTAVAKNATRWEIKKWNF